MASAVTALESSPANHIRRMDAKGRIKQLLRRNREMEEQAEYLHRALSMLIPYVQKPVVTRVLRDAKGENKSVRTR